MSNQNHFEVSRETRAHQRKTELVACAGFIFVLICMAGAAYLVVELRNLFPDWIGHIGKWVMGAVAVVVAGFISLRIAARYERILLKLPPA